MPWEQINAAAYPGIAPPAAPASSCPRVTLHARVLPAPSLPFPRAFSHAGASTRECSLKLSFSPVAVTPWRRRGWQLQGPVSVTTAALPYGVAVTVPEPVPEASSLPDDPPLRSEHIDLTRSIKGCRTWQQLRKLYWAHRSRQGMVNVVAYWTQLAALAPDLADLLASGAEGEGGEGEDEGDEEREDAEQQDNGEQEGGSGSGAAPGGPAVRGRAEALEAKGAWSAGLAAASGRGGGAGRGQGAVGLGAGSATEPGTVAGAAYGYRGPKLTGRGGPAGGERPLRLSTCAERAALRQLVVRLIYDTCSFTREHVAAGRLEAALGGWHAVQPPDTPVFATYLAERRSAAAAASGARPRGPGASASSRTRGGGAEPAGGMEEREWRAEMPGFLEWVRERPEVWRDPLASRVLGGLQHWDAAAPAAAAGSAAGAADAGRSGNAAGAAAALAQAQARRQPQCFGPLELCTVAWAAARLRLAAAVPGHAPWLLHDLLYGSYTLMPYLDGRQLAQLAYSLAALGPCVPPGRWQRRFLAVAWERFDEMDGQSLANLAHSLAPLRLAPSAVWLRRLLAASGALLEARRLGPAEMTQLAWAVFSAKRRLYRPRRWAAEVLRVAAAVHQQHQAQGARTPGADAAARSAGGSDPASASDPQPHSAPLPLDLPRMLLRTGSGSELSPRQLQELRALLLGHLMAVSPASNPGEPIAGLPPPGSLSPAAAAPAPASAATPPPPPAAGLSSTAYDHRSSDTGGGGGGDDEGDRAYSSSAGDGRLPSPNGPAAAGEGGRSVGAAGGAAGSAPGTADAGRTAAGEPGGALDGGVLGGAAGRNGAPGGGGGGGTVGGSDPWVSDIPVLAVLEHVAAAAGPHVPLAAWLLRQPPAVLLAARRWATRMASGKRRLGLWGSASGGGGDCGGGGGGEGFNSIASSYAEYMCLQPPDIAATFMGRRAQPLGFPGVMRARRLAITTSAAAAVSPAKMLCTIALAGGQPSGPPYDAADASEGGSHCLATASRSGSPSASTTATAADTAEPSLLLRLHTRCWPSTTWLDALASAASAQLRSPAFRAQSLGILLWSLAGMGYTPPPGWLAPWLARAAELQADFRPPNLVSVLCALSAWGQLPAGRPGAALRAAAVRLLPRMGGRELQLTASALAQLGELPEEAESEAAAAGGTGGRNAGVGGGDGGEGGRAWGRAAWGGRGGREWAGQSGGRGFGGPGLTDGEQLFRPLPPASAITPGGVLSGVALVTASDRNARRERKTSASGGTGDSAAAASAQPQQQLRLRGQVGLRRRELDPRVARLLLERAVAVSHSYTPRHMAAMLRLLVHRLACPVDAAALRALLHGNAIHLERLAASAAAAPAAPAAARPRRRSLQRDGDPRGDAGPADEERVGGQGAGVGTGAGGGRRRGGSTRRRELFDLGAAALDAARAVAGSGEELDDQQAAALLPARWWRAYVAALSALSKGG